jgi:hypothetical protein
MRTVRTTIGNTEVLIEAIDENVEVLGPPAGGRATRPTSITDDLQKAYGKAKAIIAEIAEDISKEIHEVSSASRPAELALEFDLGFSAQAGAWVITGKGECALKVTMTWKFGGDE